MSDVSLAAIRDLLSECSLEEQETLFRELRQRHIIHEFERIIGAPAEMILEAVHRAPELTRRMLRGVIADAAFRTFVVPVAEPEGWRDVTPEGNFAYDYMMEDEKGQVSVQVKLQRSERGAPVVKDGARFGFEGKVFMTETQKTRTGNDGDGEKTRPYRYGEFDVLAVSMQPSTGKWDRYMYTLGRWLLPGKGENEMATMQPVAMTPNEFWTDDFATVAAWFRANDGGKRMAMAAAVKPGPRKKLAKAAADDAPQLF
ncbi:hypothetical protein [Burkholderia multivorans]|uniref:hypothetical protein n=1 Tax=Burkholderia multivorans TaxID=87883 RepID=UPI0011B277F0|nr:hypothetical protein [Burkholderia multivorans]MBR8243090.1 hypothetical protein [Burkholderia multivorans]MDR9174169.1 hypothetical protein [Burkholderia multivorans]MDR9183171.1 hypothetical protein [Burkholderia multivorans]MDR9189118.1 hypothetical protein [Burkholderia multivorans]MDR9194225.1 hypothetical protein [Burkholderia multivorans]